MTKIKLCGLTRKEDIQYANEAAPDYVGFVFDKGRHFVSDETARECRSILDPCIPAAGVFVREDPGHIIHLVREGIIQLVQLHGSESESYIERLKTRISCPIIRVISVKSKEDILKGQETAAALRTITGVAWKLSLLDAPGEPTLKEAQDAVAEAERQAVLASPIVQAAMEAFPDAELIDWPNKRNSA